MSGAELKDLQYDVSTAISRAWEEKEYCGRGGKYSRTTEL